MTIRDIARSLGVSHVTVSYALRGLPRVSDETRRKVCAEAERMGSLVVDEAVYKSERDVVKEELRQRVLASPYGRLFALYLPDGLWGAWRQRTGIDLLSAGIRFRPAAEAPRAGVTIAPAGPAGDPAT